MESVVGERGTILVNIGTSENLFVCKSKAIAVVRHFLVSDLKF